MIKIKFNLLMSFLLFLISCSDKKCNCDVDQKIVIQKYETLNETIVLNNIEQGSLGSIITLKICDINNTLVEEIYLRGDDVKPKIDSIVRNNIYISYKYPSSTHEEINFEIPFDNIVLGDGLLKKNTLKFKYIFFGRYVKER